jgi:hypothetical protein
MYLFSVRILTRITTDALQIATDDRPGNMSQSGCVTELRVVSWSDLSLSFRRLVTCVLAIFYPPQRPMASPPPSSIHENPGAYFKEAIREAKSRAKLCELYGAYLEDLANVEESYGKNVVKV